MGKGRGEADRIVSLEQATGVCSCVPTRHACTQSKQLLGGRGSHLSAKNNALGGIRTPYKCTRLQLRQTI